MAAAELIDRQTRKRAHVLSMTQKQYVVWTSKMDDPDRRLLREALHAIKSSGLADVSLDNVSGPEDAPRRLLVSASKTAIDSIASSLDGTIQIEENKSINPV